MIQDVTYWKERPEEDTARDWDYNSSTWVEDYIKSVDHPHRKVILDLLEEHPPETLLEIGCNAGPNLKRIQHHFPQVKLTGMDASAQAIEAGCIFLPGVSLSVGNFNEGLPYEDKSFDWVLADAVLMYSNPEEINYVMDELDRVAKHILIVERFNDSKEGVAHHVWARNYAELLLERGRTVTQMKITKEMWPTSENWIKYGRFFIA